MLYIILILIANYGQDVIHVKDGFTQHATEELVKEEKEKEEKEAKLDGKSKKRKSKKQTRNQRQSKKQKH